MSRILGNITEITLVLPIKICQNQSSSFGGVESIAVFIAENDRGNLF